MLYMGGKGRTGKEITQVIITSTTKRGVLLEPFLGGGNSFKHLAPHFQSVLAGDAHEDLMFMWQAAAQGWRPPLIVSEEDYATQRTKASSALRGFVGFGCSFGGKWWGGYARVKKSSSTKQVSRSAGPVRRSDPEYFTDAASRSVIKIARLMPPNVSGELRHTSYDQWSVTPDYVVYADPPYAGTTKYKDQFDHAKFWSTMTQWSRLGASVFVSEYTAPPNWTAVWTKDQRKKVSGGTGDMSSEKLWIMR